MLLRRSLITALSMSFALLLSGGTSAEEQWEEGVHYTLINPAIRMPGKNVVVTEFFWYGCGHCYNFEPMLEAWGEQLPEGSVLEPSPAAWNDGMSLHARAYYTALALKVKDQVHLKIFEAMNLKRNRLGSQAAIKEIFVANGVDGDAFDNAFTSFGVDSQVRLADSRARQARITGTPSMMVAGKYMISTRGAGSQANMLKIAEYLVEKELEKRAAEEAAGA